MSLSCQITVGWTQACLVREVMSGSADMFSLGCTKQPGWAAWS